MGQARSRGSELPEESQAGYDVDLVGGPGGERGVCGALRMGVPLVGGYGTDFWLSLGYPTIRRDDQRRLSGLQFDPHSPSGRIEDSDGPAPARTGVSLSAVGAKRATDFVGDHCFRPMDPDFKYNDWESGAVFEQDVPRDVEA